MKFLFDLPNEELLPATYDLIEAVSEFSEKTKIMELRRPAQDGETSAEAGKKIVREMMKRMCKEFPQETARLSDKFWVLADGETAPLATKTIAKIVNSPDALDFFISVLPMVQ